MERYKTSLNTSKSESQLTVDPYIAQLIRKNQKNANPRQNITPIKPERGSDTRFQRHSSVKEINPQSNSKDASPKTRLSTERISPSPPKKMSISPLLMQLKLRPLKRRRNMLAVINKNIDESMVNNDFISHLEEMKKQAEIISSLLDIDVMNWKLKILDSLESIFNHTKPLGITTLLLGVVEVYYLTTIMFKEYKKGIILLKFFKSICTVCKFTRLKLKAYKWLALVYQEMRDHDKAVIFLKKLLISAWYQKDLNKEMVAYDLLGMQYFYLGNSKRAKFYHEKMSSGISEPRTSAIRSRSVSHLSIKMSSMSERISTIEEAQAYKVYISSGEEDLSLSFEVSDEEEEEPKQIDLRKLPKPERIYKRDFKLDQIKHQKVRLPPMKPQYQRSLESSLGIRKPKEVRSKSPYIVKQEKTGSMEVMRDIVQQTKLKLNSSRINEHSNVTHLSPARNPDNFNYLNYSRDRDINSYSFTIGDRIRNKLKGKFQNVLNEIEKNFQDSKSIIYYKDLSYKFNTQHSNLLTSEDVYD